MQRTSKDNEECSYSAPEFRGMRAGVQLSWNMLRNVSESVQFLYLDSESPKSNVDLYCVYLQLADEDWRSQRSCTLSGSAHYGWNQNWGPV